ncbi:hypothetical protein [Saccharopolyspora pogona]|uniref:hypothetical protein n=1 Tax=Saccharopolyspora pogona TaxID=333966 RepID=UPI001687DDA7|nr:hypothetical protein [Saccharopolyspora pogona]
MVVLISSLLAALTFGIVAFGWIGRSTGQHAGAGEGALGVWQLCARVAIERQREMETEVYGRHALLGRGS